MTDSELSRLLRHYLPEEVLAALRAAERELAPEAYEEALQTALRTSHGLQEQVRRNRETATKLTPEIAYIPPGRFRILLENSPPLMLLALAHETIGGSFADRFDHHERSLRLAEIGLEVVGRIRDISYLDSLAQADLEAEALLYLGNARRINSDLRGAESAFLEADTLLAEGTGDRGLKAQALSLKASLRLSQGRCRDAASLWDREIRLRKLLGEREKLGLALINRGLVAAWSEPLSKACGYFAEGVLLVEDVECLLLTLNPIADRLARDGRGFLAWRVICQAETALAFAGSEGHRLRLRWAKGITYRTQGHLESASQELEAVRDELIREDLIFRAALASLDLAAVYVAQGRWQHVKEVADEAYAVFVAERLEHPALAAFLAFRLAARAETLTESLAVKVANFLVRSQYDKNLRFEAPSES